MANPCNLNTYYFPKADNYSICNAVAGISAGNVPFNGNLTKSPEWNNRYIVFKGIATQLIIKSAINLSSVNFTINGTYNGVSVSETIAGPVSSGTSQLTTKYFNTVTSITCSGAIAGNANLSIGNSFEGVTNWLTYDYFRIAPNMIIQSVVIDGDLKYTFEATYDDIEGITQEDETNNLSNFYICTPLSGLVDATTTKVTFSDVPFRYVRFSVNEGDTADGDEEFRCSFFQQGISS